MDFRGVKMKPEIFPNCHYDPYCICLCLEMLNHYEWKDNLQCRSPSHFSICWGERMSSSCPLTPPPVCALTLDGLGQIHLRLSAEPPRHGHSSPAKPPAPGLSPGRLLPTQRSQPSKSQVGRLRRSHPKTVTAPRPYLFFPVWPSWEAKPICSPRQEER